MAEFLDQKPAEKPFFLWANFSDPHHVWNAPAEFRPDPASLRLPAHWPDLPGMREQLADYCAEVNRVDRTIAGVLDVLGKRGLLDNTLIVFAGDNGAALPHGKGSLYDPGSNVPLIVRWPGVVKAGGESRALLSGEDLGPTLLAAAGLEPHPRMSGVSFLALLRGESSYAAQTHLCRTRPARFGAGEREHEQQRLRSEPRRPQRPLQVHLQLHALDSLLARGLRGRRRLDADQGRRGRRETGPR